MKGNDYKTPGHFINMTKIRLRFSTSVVEVCQLQYAQLKKIKGNSLITHPRS